MKAKDQFLDELGDKFDEALSLVNEAVALAAYYRRMLERLERDSLTGLLGSNKFRDFIEDIESRMTSIGVIYFDVNNLKYYNDTKGHHAGDLLLQKAAESIIMAAHGKIYAFRIGGDEFVVIMENCIESDINTFLAKWREKLSELNAVADGIHCSVAAGSAFASGRYSINDVIKTADGRMYTEKRRMKDNNAGEIVQSQ